VGSARGDEIEVGLRVLAEMDEKGLLMKEPVVVQ
jgi:hypothetical protein